MGRAGIEREPVLVAVSGGGDSMALLEIVSLLAQARALALHVAYVDHGMRAEAAVEQEMVCAAARERGARFHHAAIDPGSGDEVTLRDRRHRALQDVAREVGARFILLGHTSDDQIETIVFRFLRGAGLGGLAGMREVRPPFVRPLLATRREELREVLRAQGVSWAEDPSNVSERYARGRLRSGVLPAITRLFGRGALEHLLDVAPRWRADDDYLETEAARLLAYASRRGESGVELDATALAGAHPALRARALRRWIDDRTGRAPASRELAVVERWLASAEDDAGGVDVAGARVVRARGRLAITPSTSAQPRAHSLIDIRVSSDDALRSVEEDEDQGERRRS